MDWVVGGASYKPRRGKSWWIQDCSNRQTALHRCTTPRSLSYLMDAQSINTSMLRFLFVSHKHNLFEPVHLLVLTRSWRHRADSMRTMTVVEARHVWFLTVQVGDRLVLNKFGLECCWIKHQSRGLWRNVRVNERRRPKAGDRITSWGHCTKQANCDDSLDHQIYVEQIENQQFSKANFYLLIQPNDQRTRLPLVVSNRVCVILIRSTVNGLILLCILLYTLSFNIMVHHAFINNRLIWLSSNRLVLPWLMRPETTESGVPPWAWSEHLAMRWIFNNSWRCVCCLLN